jgi:putative membrane protein
MCSRWVRSAASVFFRPDSTLEEHPMRQVLRLSTALAAFVLAAGIARSDDEQKMVDLKFAKEANQINLEEIQVGKLAQQRSVNAAIKKFGERLAQDHAKMNEELVALARKKGVILSKDFDAATQETVDRFMKLSGAEFDRAFSKAMVSGHEKAIEKFQAEAKTGRDADVKAWAEKRVATLREHLEMARTTLTAAR